MIKATYIDHMGSDISVVNAARVSFGKKSGWEYDNTDAYDHMGYTKKYLSKLDTKLIQYLAKHKHMSPFGHAFATFHVKAPVFVARQLVKHKFLRWNEISRRYVDSEPEFYLPDVWRGRSDDKKQGSEGVIELDKTYAYKSKNGEYEHIKDVFEKEPETYGEYKDSIVPDHSLLDEVHECEEYVLQAYRTFIEAGVCPEQARMVLPQSTMTEWYWSGSLDAFSDMCVLRCASDTQAETQKVAAQISVKMHELFPVSWMALGTGSV
jgi:thymidylate synthase (FAD)